MDKQAHGMTFNGFIKADLVNYPGKVAAVVFTQGCNFRCPYCHNPQLVECTITESYQDTEIIEYLLSRRTFIEGFVISGGEPTLHRELPDFIMQVKSLGFSIKLDTNGSNPEMLNTLIQNNMLDYVAMDLKAPFEKYCLLGCSDTSEIQESMKVLRASAISYEFRTTCVKELLSEEDMYTIKKLISPDEVWKLNPFNSKITLEKRYQQYHSYSAEELSKFKNIL